MLKDAGLEELNPAQGRIMFALWQGDGIPISELATRTQLEKSTLTSMLDRLEANDFVRRESDPQDRRRILIQRTDKDRRWQARYEEVSQRMGAVFYAGLESSEVDVFEATLARVLENLIAAQ